ncbi:hypothetical protein K438DRAFT_1838643 [Mycena galopus ATCC 62051]|nr:hypothetical protein K438DRAFT_1838643 [Mycena galopus ATCC 62051]
MESGGTEDDVPDGGVGWGIGPKAGWSGEDGWTDEARRRIGRGSGAVRWAEAGRTGGSPDPDMREKKARDLTNSPDSPQVCRPRAVAKRRVASDVNSDSDEDFLPGTLLTGPSKLRITRGRPRGCRSSSRTRAGTRHGFHSVQV